MAFFDINHLNSGYPKAFHLKDVTFSLSKGVFAGVIGPNGSGKSTLLKAITQEINIQPKTIFLNGIDVSIMSPVEKAQQIAVVSQFNEPLDISVEDYVLLGRMPYKSRFQFFETERDFDIARKNMELTGVSHLKNQMFSHLSGGEQQLVSLAKALTQEPQLLLLDEPTAHLDITHQVQVLNLIQQLSEQLDLTILMIIHDLNLAGEYCDQLIMMKNGSIYDNGLPQAVLTYKNIEKKHKILVLI